MLVHLERMDPSHIIKKVFKRKAAGEEDKGKCTDEENDLRVMGIRNWKRMAQKRQLPQVAVLELNKIKCTIQIYT